MRSRRSAAIALGCALFAAACASLEPMDAASVGDPSTPQSSVRTTQRQTTEPETTEPVTTQPVATPSTTTATSAADDAASAIPIRIRLDRRVDDDATAGFADLTRAVLTDPRGWQRAGFAFSFAAGSSTAADGEAEGEYDYTVVLAEGAEVDQLCLPYDTGGRFSCQIGPVVALNADRWRTAVESWPASLDDYRTMLVNHEVGHLIGQHHPADRCAGDGQPAPVMSQQSSGVAPCTANPWPLEWEIACASLGLEPLAPPFERNIELTCGPDGPLQ